MFYLVLMCMAISSLAGSVSWLYILVATNSLPDETKMLPGYSSLFDIMFDGVNFKDRRLIIASMVFRSSFAVFLVSFVTSWFV